MSEFEFASREEASLAAAERMAAALERRLDAQAEASLVVSGGTTPARCFEALNRIPLAWSRVHVLLSDERWVPPDSEDSNERLVRSALLQNRAAEARLLPVYQAGADAAAGAQALDTAIRSGPFPFACALLGMGTDGHFASLFPDAENLAQGLDVESQTLAIPVATSSSPHPRVSLTLSALARSDEILLLIFGEDKREVCARAAQKDSPYPVTRLIYQKRAPVHVFWAP